MTKLKAAWIDSLITSPSLPVTFAWPLPGTVTLSIDPAASSLTADSTGAEVVGTITNDSGHAIGNGTVHVGVAGTVLDTANALQRWTQGQSGISTPTVASASIGAVPDGAPMVPLDADMRATAQADLVRSRADLELDQLEFERREALVESGDVRLSERDAALAARDASAAAVEAAAARAAATGRCSAPPWRRRTPTISSPSATARR